jgi:hypothetical protein
MPPTRIVFRRSPFLAPAATPARPVTPASPAADLAAYPVLTEEVGFPPSPLASPGAGGAGAGSGSSLGQIASKAVADVLGWKIKAGDTKGFVGALTQSFTLTETEGHIESKWTPRSYAVQTDLSGGITGAQASVYSRAKEALDQCLPLLDGLYPLDTEAVVEDVAALKSVAKSQLTELVNEMGYLGGPRIQRVNQYFNLLLGTVSYPLSPSPGQSLNITDPDKVQGTLGNLRDELGLSFSQQDFVNSVDDETNLSNYRIVSDYVTSLAQSWINNLAYLGLNTKTPFFGTQLVLLSRQLLVVAESVDEVRFVLDSVFIGPAERQTILLNFGSSTQPPMFLEDLLSWTRNFASDEGPRLVQDGGKFAVQNTFVPVAGTLSGLIASAQSSSGPLPPGFQTPRVTFALNDLSDQLTELVNLASPIEHDITPQPDFGLPFEIDSTQPGAVFLSALTSPAPVFVRGSGFQNGAQVKISPATLNTFQTVSTFFRSESLLMVYVTSTGAVTGPTPGPSAGNTMFAVGNAPGSWDLQVTNPDGTSTTLSGGLTVQP